jgi:hypothetical protein
MKKQLLLFVAAASFYTATAQITITQSDIGSPGDVIRRGNDTIFAGIIGPGGTNMTWNYTSDLGIDYVDTISFVNPSSMPSYSVFPTSNLGIQIGNFADGYAVLTASSLSMIGEAGTFFGVYGELQFSDPEQLFQLPANYGDNYTDLVIYGAEVAYSTTGVDSVRLKTTKNKTVDIDSWGSMTTLSGTVNVLRQKEFTTQIDSIWIHTPGIPPFIPPGWQFYQEQFDTTYHYGFMANGLGYPFAEIDSSYNANTSAYDVTASWTLAPGVGLKETAKASGSIVYPNPASNAVTVMLANAPQNAYTIEVCNIMGAVVKSVNASGSKNVIATEELNPGLYMYRIISNEGAMLGQGKFEKN